MLKVRLEEKTLHFKKPARTSRGSYDIHRMILVHLDDGCSIATGECAPLPDLSCDRLAYQDLDITEKMVRDAIGIYTIENNAAELASNVADRLKDLPALRFAVESALSDLGLYDAIKHPVLGRMNHTAFAQGKAGIPINGLVWMSDYDDMLHQIESKIAAGFRCIKLKIGAIEWENEMKLIRLIRSRFTRGQLELRVDANGAFSVEEAPAKLEELARYDIHSIEQPLRQGQWEAMSELCSGSPVAIALDEELIGLNDIELKRSMLTAIHPKYIVIKPTLHGGLSGACEWVELAGSLGIASWMTSALESNIGLRSVALLSAATYQQPSMPQGLGTGQLFIDNIDNGITLRPEDCTALRISEMSQAPRSEQSSSTVKCRRNCQ